MVFGKTDDTVEVLHPKCQQIWKIQQWPQYWKRSVSIPIAKRDNAKECSNYCTVALISHTSKIMLNNFQSQASAVYAWWTCRSSTWIYQRQRNQRLNYQHPLDHWKSKRVPEKHLLLLYLLHQSFWLCGPQQIGKFFKGWENQTILPASWEICIQFKKQ